LHRGFAQQHAGGDWKRGVVAGEEPLVFMKRLAADDAIVRAFDDLVDQQERMAMRDGGVNNGEVQISGAYDHGELRGTWKRYYPGGGLLEEVTYEDNLENGPFMEYYKNGNLKARGKYLDGDFEHDTLFMYAEAGTLARLMLCNRGICNTIWIADSTKVEHRISEE
jgi:hypothetical protein